MPSCYNAFMLHELERTMGVVIDHQVIKSIGSSGQISLGKEHAGRQVLIENPEPGVWVIRTATVIPDNERWIHTPTVKKNLTAALEWAEKTPAKASDLSKLKISKAHGSKRKA
jgi:putative transposon-encoded protein